MRRLDVILATLFIHVFMSNLCGQTFSEHEKSKAKELIHEMYYTQLPDSVKILPYDSLMNHVDRYTFLIDRSTRAQWLSPSRTDRARYGFSYKVHSSDYTINTIRFEGPAYSAGLVKENCIIAINGRYPSDEDEFDYMLVGDSGTSCVLTIQEKQTGNFTFVELQKDYLEDQDVYVDRIGKSAIIRLDNFHEDIHKHFINASHTLIPETVDTLILDIRSNPGGYVDEAVRILSEFMPTKKAIIKYKFVTKSDTLRTYDSHFGMWSHLKKIYVLINSTSASASEILAGVLMKMDDRAEIVGDTSYGKGLVQSSFPISPGGSYLHVTVAEYYPGLDLKVNKIGVIPQRKLHTLEKVPIPSNAEILNWRQDYPMPSTIAFEDQRLKGKEYLADYIWGIRGQLFAILAKGLCKK